jgi:large repetitive protein
LDQPECGRDRRGLDGVPISPGATPAAGGPSMAAGEGAAWGLWRSGAIRFGDRDATTGRLSESFESEGVSLGLDRRLSPGLAIGIGAGLGRETVDVGDMGSQSKAEAATLAVYASKRLGASGFLDGMAGWQTLDYDLRRHVTASGQMVTADRSGDQVFASISLGVDLRGGGWLLTPYGRWDLVHIGLDDYVEDGGSMFDLRFLDQDIRASSLVIGGRARYRHDARWGWIEPHLRIEYLSELDADGEARVGYADQLPNLFSTIPVAELGREHLSLGLGVEVSHESGLDLRIEYTGRMGPDVGSDHGIRLGISRSF